MKISRYDPTTDDRGNPIMQWEINGDMVAYSDIEKFIKVLKEMVSKCPDCGGVGKFREPYPYEFESEKCDYCFKARELLKDIDK